MRQAVATQFHGPTNHRGARVIAKAEAGRMTHNWDYALGIGGNHRAAAQKLVEKFGWGWGDHWAGGGLPGSGFAFVDSRDGGL